ncbi:NBS-LRR type resistance protein [Cucumis melo var. makuwa]|uniref:NBS-LRR type resistance protein n=1 Tax=Cucumis melo var. makuwa TaxID=1194695 RepID=A0A5A7TVX9_CUCMM|nr:NBS-LRR type resistance protein [Cucumis melo var. makuwa]
MRPYGLHASFLPLVGLPLAVPLPEKLKKRKERTYQSRDPEGCTYQSSDPEGCTYQSSAPKGCTYQSSALEGCTYQSSAPEGCTYQSSALEGYTYPLRQSDRIGVNNYILSCYMRFQFTHHCDIPRSSQLVNLNRTHRPSTTKLHDQCPDKRLPPWRRSTTGPASTQRTTEGGAYTGCWRREPERRSEKQSSGEGRRGRKHWKWQRRREEEENEVDEGGKERARG